MKRKLSLLDWFGLLLLVLIYISGCVNSQDISLEQDIITVVEHECVEHYTFPYVGARDGRVFYVDFGNDRNMSCLEMQVGKVYAIKLNGKNIKSAEELPGN